VAGNRLGAIRDNHGKSVYEVFQGLDAETRSNILARLAQKILTQTFTI
jgi:diphthamide biosynthesis protein 4